MFVVSGGAWASAAHEPSLLRDAVGLHPVPRTDGRTVVWQEGGRGIWTATLDSRRPFAVTTNGGVQLNPDVDGDLIVWSELNQACTACGYDIRGKNMATGQVLDISSAPGNEQVPSVSGTRVAWVHDDGATTRLLVRDIRGTAAPLTVTELPSSARTVIYRAAIDGEHIVWGQAIPVSTHSQRWELFARLFGVFARQPGLGSATRLADGTDTGSFGLTGYDLAGQTVVYGAGRQVWLRDVAGSGGPTELAGNGMSPTTDGRYVFWEDYTSQDRVDIRGHDLTTASYFAAAVASGANSLPRIGGGALVWGSGQDSAFAVHAARVADILPSGRQPDPGKTSPEWTYFPETGHYLSTGFQHFWRRSGGLPVFGYPLTEEFGERNADTGQVLSVQYLERQRFEYHPEHARTPYEVELGRLGIEEAQQRGLLGTAAFQPRPAGTPSNATCTFFPETGHHLCASFRAYWQGHGLEFGDPGLTYRESLALFGYPISEEFTDPQTGLVTQYFERARFEWHPNNPEPYRVLLGRLAADRLAQRGW